MAEWDWEKNADISPYQTALGSHRKVWWKCSEKHEYEATIKNRHNGSKCPYCTGKAVLTGFNDLETTHPHLAKEWHPAKNGILSPKKISFGSIKKVWWKCSSGHEWQATIHSRKKGHGCPYCFGRYAITGIYDLQTTNPMLSEEWHYEKNNGLTPAEVTPKSEKKVWWKCKKGHEWQAVISSRSNGSGCPLCNSERNTSFPEYALLYYLKKYGLDVVHSYKQHGYELDIYIPTKKIAIEYDGYFWHKNKVEIDLAKNQKCRQDRIILYRIREGLPSLDDSSIDYIVKKDQQNLSQIIIAILKDILEIVPDVDVKRDSIDIENLREYIEKANSILYMNPLLTKEWNYNKNGRLKPEHFSLNSHKKVWWVCDNGHEWQATIRDRNLGRSCPYCSGRYAVAGVNDLQTTYPSLEKEWDHAKNGILNPNLISPNSHQKVWWKCSKGHEWQAVISARTRGNNCPYCSGRYAIKGENDLQTINPSLAQEWNYDKNGDLIPTNVLPNSGKRVWWVCDRGHEWQAIIRERNNGTNCPYCSGRYAIKGETDLQTINPVLAKEWNYGKNIDLTPTDVLPNSHKRVWWKCSHGHEWQAAICDRNRGIGCPYCSRKRKLQ